MAKFTPGVFIQVLAQTKPTEQTKTALVVLPGATNIEPKLCTTLSDVSEQFGADSLHFLVASQLQFGVGKCKLFFSSTALPADPAAATSTLTVTGTGLGGTFTLNVFNKTIPLTLPSSVTSAVQVATSFADALQNAGINTARNAAVLTITAPHKGIVFNDVEGIEVVKPQNSGFVFASTKFANGVGVLNTEAALTQMTASNQNFDFFLFPDASLDAQIKVRDFLTLRREKGLFSFAFFATGGKTLAEFTALNAAHNEFSVCFATQRLTVSAAELVAQFGMFVAHKVADNPSFGGIGVTVPVSWRLGVFAPEVAEGFLQVGGSIIATQVDGQAQIVRLIVTKYKNGKGLEDRTFVDANKVFLLISLRAKQLATLMVVFENALVVPDNQLTVGQSKTVRPSDVALALKALYAQEFLQARVTNVDNYNNTVSARINQSDKSSIEFFDNPTMVTPLARIEGTSYIGV